MRGLMVTALALSCGGDATPERPCKAGRTVVQLAAGNDHTCALTDEGEVYCWGRNSHVQLGYVGEGVGAKDEAACAEPVPLGAKAVSIDATQNRACALLENGDLRCWGSNQDHSMGYGNYLWDSCATCDERESCCYGDDESIADLTVDVGEPVTEVLMGGRHTCAVLDGGRVRCWGDPGAHGYEANKIIGDDEHPSTMPTFFEGVVAGDAGDWFNCMLIDSDVRCFGWNTVGQVGGGSTSPARIAADSVPFGWSDVATVATGHSSACAAGLDGTVRCWGINYDSQLGYADNNGGCLLLDGESTSPSSTCMAGPRCCLGDEPGEEPDTFEPVDVGEPVLDVVMSSKFAETFHICALLEGGRVKCWGDGEDGQLGYGNTDRIGDDETPAAVGAVDVGAEVQQVVAGGNHTCVLTTSGKVRCWGANDHGQLGYGHTETIGDDETPAEVGDVPL